MEVHFQKCDFFLLSQLSKVPDPCTKVKQARTPGFYAKLDSLAFPPDCRWLSKCWKDNVSAHSSLISLAVTEAEADVFDRARQQGEVRGSGRGSRPGEPEKQEKHRRNWWIMWLSHTGKIWLMTDRTGSSRWLEALGWIRCFCPCNTQLLTQRGRAKRPEGASRNRMTSSRFWKMYGSRCSKRLILGRERDIISPVMSSLLAQWCLHIVSNLTPTSWRDPLGQWSPWTCVWRTAIVFYLGLRFDDLSWFSNVHFLCQLLLGVLLYLIGCH